MFSVKLLDAEHFVRLITVKWVKRFVEASVWQARLLWLSNPGSLIDFFFSVPVAHLSVRKCWHLRTYLNLDDKTFMVWLRSSYLSWPGLELGIPLATPHSMLLLKYVE